MMGSAYVSCGGAVDGVGQARFGNAEYYIYTPCRKLDPMYA